MNKARVTLFVFCWACIPTAFLLWLATRLWSDAPGIYADNFTNETKGMGLVITLGAIGGYIRWMHNFKTIHYDAEKFWQWMFNSALTPLMGAALALVSCIAFRAGFAVHGGQGRTDVVNWVSIYALAGLTGLFSPDAIKRLEVIFRSAFAPDSKGSDGGMEPPAPQPPSDIMGRKE